MKASFTTRNVEGNRFFNLWKSLESCAMSCWLIPTITMICGLVCKGLSINEMVLVKKPEFSQIPFLSTNCSNPLKMTGDWSITTNFLIILLAAIFHLTSLLILISSPDFA